MNLELITSNINEENNISQREENIYTSDKKGKYIYTVFAAYKYTYLYSSVYGSFFFIIFFNILILFQAFVLFCDFRFFLYFFLFEMIYLF